MKKLKPKFYKKAAIEMVENRILDYQYSCNAIRFVTKDQDEENPYILEYSNFFRPDDHYDDDPWFGDELLKENLLARSLALLFMEKIVEEEI